MYLSVLLFTVDSRESRCRKSSGPEIRNEKRGDGNQEETREGVLFVTTACCTMTRDNFDKSPDKGFRLFSFKGETVESRFVPVKVPGW